MSQLMRITLTSRWRETTCGLCPDYRCTRREDWLKIFDPIRRRMSWKLHKRGDGHRYRMRHGIAG